MKQTKERNFKEKLINNVKCYKKDEYAKNLAVRRLPVTYEQFVWFSNMASESTALASSRKFIDMQIIRPHTKERKARKARG